MLISISFVDVSLMFMIGLIRWIFASHWHNVVRTFLVCWQSNVSSQCHRLSVRMCRTGILNRWNLWTSLEEHNMVANHHPGLKQPDESLPRVPPSVMEWHHSLHHGSIHQDKVLLNVPYLLINAVVVFRYVLFTVQVLLHAVQRHWVYSAAYGTVYYIKPLNIFDIIDT